MIYGQPIYFSGISPRWALHTSHLWGFLKGLQVRSQPREGRRVEWNPFIILENSAPDDGPYGPYYKREFPC
ncbi:MAG: hypothetical protein ACLFUS_14100, partial [Candidatus Sumerlaeia bacterium]